MRALWIMGGVGALAAFALLFTFEYGPIKTVQRGYRGTAMAQVYEPALLAQKVSENQIPPSLPQLPPVGPKAAVVYKNVQVLGDLSVGQFTRLMASITIWVAPKQGCNYCHNPNNMASDEIYTKVVARRMIQMTQNVNLNWQTHVAATGVTCYTCHRGNNIPVNVWFNDAGRGPMGLAETGFGKNKPGPLVGEASLPNNPFTPFLEQDLPIRVNSTTPLPSGDRQSIKQAEWTYALMVHFSTALGVNCTYCHNTRAFADWSQSTPQRVNAWYGIRMVREMNNEYLDSLNAVFPDYRKGPTGDVAKVNCTTCHQGAFKPLLGVSMARAFPELGGQPAPKPAAQAPQPATPEKQAMAQ